MPTIRSLIDDRLTATRQSQADAADELGVSQATISRWRSGEHSPGPEHLPALAAWLAMPEADVFAAWTGDQTSRPKPTKLDIDATLAAILERLEEIEARLRRRPR